MIGDGLFATQVNTCRILLDKIDLLERHNPFPNRKLGATSFRGLSYRQTYEKCIQEQAYDFLLTDQSLILFVKSGKNLEDGVLGFNYYECPVSAPSYKEFLCSQFNSDLLGPEAESLFEEIGDSLSEEYSKHLETLDHKYQVTPIRYDCKASDYRPGVHPASHFHFGFSSNVRIGTFKILNPISFLLFVIRQCYPAFWEKVLIHADADSWCQNVRNNLDDLPDDYWSDTDDLELSLA